MLHYGCNPVQAILGVNSTIYSRFYFWVNLHRQIFLFILILSYICYIYLEYFWIFSVSIFIICFKILQPTSTPKLWDEMNKLLKWNIIILKVKIVFGRRIHSKNKFKNYYLNGTCLGKWIFVCERKREWWWWWFVHFSVSHPLSMGWKKLRNF